MQALRTNGISMMRREVLLATTMALLAGCTPGTKTILNTQSEEIALLPSATGSLSEPEREMLRTIADTIAARWQLPILDHGTLDATLDEKTEQSPSYLAEYRHAIMNFRQRPAGQSAARWLQEVIEQNDGSNSSAFIRIRQFVIGEFIALNLINGGFRQFGGINYRGYVAGPRVYTRSTFSA